ncbi:Uncharacterised protein [Mycobacteroides abscessus subsp. abscessus]|nr:Uncharacterised protein [Mycobacteroides abscessus subsp. abscessus]
MKDVSYSPVMNFSCLTTFSRKGIFVLIPRILNSCRFLTIFEAACSKVSAHVDSLTSSES